MSRAIHLPDFNRSLSPKALYTMSI
jgi:hypothetical protein